MRTNCKQVEEILELVVAANTGEREREKKKKRICIKWNCIFDKIKAQFALRLN